MTQRHDEHQYLDLLRAVLEGGIRRDDRTGVGTIALFGHQMRFDLSKGFPLLTTKQLHVRSIIHELLWFLRGETNIAELKRVGVSIWDPWADQAGELGPIYGKQWRSWATADGRTVDQIKGVLDAIQDTPHSRRLVISAWNVGELESMALPPCHILFQFFVANGRLSCQLYQRSADVFLGLPFNIASYSLLTMMVAQVSNLTPWEFVHTLGDAHLYLNHVDQAREQLARSPKPPPIMHLDPAIDDLFAFGYEHFRLDGYEPHPHIKAPIAI